MLPVLNEFSRFRKICLEVHQDIQPILIKKFFSTQAVKFTKFLKLCSSVNNENILIFYEAIIDWLHYLPELENTNYNYSRKFLEIESSDFKKTILTFWELLKKVFSILNKKKYLKFSVLTKTFFVMISIFQ
jgi:esterase/lipase